MFWPQWWALLGHQRQNQWLKETRPWAGPHSPGCVMLPSPCSFGSTVGTAVSHQKTRMGLKSTTEELQGMVWQAPQHHAEGLADVKRQLLPALSLFFHRLLQVLYWTSGMLSDQLHWTFLHLGELTASLQNLANRRTAHEPKVLCK